MKQETIDGNRLIAEFMGFKKVQGKFYGGMKDDKENSTFPAWSDTMNIILDSRNDIPEYGLRFHSSWDWLMPVVGKIEEQGQSVSIFRGCCDIRFDKIKEGEEEPEPIESGGGQPKIVSVWQSVVRYIQWYNT